MTEILSKLTCNNCGQELSKNIDVCSHCGSKEKTMNISVYERITIAPSELTKLTNTSLPHKQKLRQEVRQGIVRSRTTKHGLAKIKRIIDKDHDCYYERIEDLNGNVIHHCEEPLSEHRGHGRAKIINSKPR